MTAAEPRSQLVQRRRRWLRRYRTALDGRQDRSEGAPELSHHQADRVSEERNSMSGEHSSVRSSNARSARSSKRSLRRCRSSQSPVPRRPIWWTRSFAQRASKSKTAVIRMAPRRVRAVRPDGRASHLDRPPVLQARPRPPAQVPAAMRTRAPQPEMKARTGRCRVPRRPKPRREAEGRSSGHVRISRRPHSREQRRRDGLGRHDRKWHRSRQRRQ